MYFSQTLLEWSLKEKKLFLPRRQTKICFIHLSAKVYGMFFVSFPEEIIEL